MSTYTEMACERKRARPLYLELRALGLGVWTEQCPDESSSYRVVVGGLRSLSVAHADRVRRCVQENETGLARVLSARSDPALQAIREEGTCV